MVERKWQEGAWWLKLSTPGVGRGYVWIRYTDLCAAFPSFKEIYTPEPDDPPENLEDNE